MACELGERSGDGCVNGLQDLHLKDSGSVKTDSFSNSGDGSADLDHSQAGLP